LNVFSFLVDISTILSGQHPRPLDHLHSGQKNYRMRQMKNSIRQFNVAHSAARAAQHSTAQHSTAQHSTAQHSTAQHSTAKNSPFNSASRPHLRKRTVLYKIPI
jgi:hypothetical protein